MERLASENEGLRDHAQGAPPEQPGAFATIPLNLPIGPPFPFDTAPRYMILDNDKIIGNAVVDVLKSMGTKLVRTAYRSPWQNPVAERWISTCRRELLNHVIVLNEEHLRRLGRELVTYYNQDRCHTTLDGDSPAGRPVQPKASPNAKVVALPRAAALHHRYEWRDVA